MTEPPTRVTGPPWTVRYAWWSARVALAVTALWLAGCVLVLTGPWVVEDWEDLWLAAGTTVGMVVSCTNAATAHIAARPPDEPSAWIRAWVAASWILALGTGAVCAVGILGVFSLGNGGPQGGLGDAFYVLGVAALTVVAGLAWANLTAVRAALARGEPPETGE